MNIDQAYTKRLVKRAMFLFLGIFLVLIIMLVIGWSVLRSDHPYVIERLQETALEKWNADLLLEGYELEITKPFPLLSLQVNGLAVGAVDQPRFLKINQAASQFNPWNLITGDFNAHPFQLDSVWVHLHQDAAQNSNVNFNQNKKTKGKRNALDLEIDELPFIKINYLDFNHQNDYRKVQQWVKLSQMSITPERQPSGEWSANFQSDSYFESLLFKPEDGPFLRNTQGKLNLNLAIADQGKTIQFDNSSLLVGQDEYLLSGQFILDDINVLKLQIKHEGVLLSNALPLLSDKINHDLRDIKIDQPIRANFNLSNDLIPERNGSVQVDFATYDAHIKFNAAEMTDAKLIGSYSNDIAKNGIGDPSTATLTIDSLEGELLNIIPIGLKGVITNLKDNPQILAEANLDINLPRLNPLLAANDKITFSDGNSLVHLNYQGNLLNVLNAPFDEQNIKLSGEAICTNISLKSGSGLAPFPSLSGSLSFDENQTNLEELLLDWMGSKVSLRGSLANLPEFLFYNDQALMSDISLHFDQVDVNKFINENKPEVASQINKPIDVAKIEKMARRLAVNLNGEIDLQIDKLIYDTLFLTDLKTHFSLYTPRLIEYIDSSMINIEELTANFMGESPLKINMRLSRDSLTNILLGMDMPKAATTVNTFLPDETEITNGNLAIHLDAQTSLRSLFSTKNLLNDLQLDGTLRFKQLELELPEFELPVRKISGDLVFDKEHLLLNEIDFQYQGSPFSVNGNIENYTFYNDNIDQKAKVDLSLKGNFINLSNIESTTSNSAEQTTLNLAELFRDLDTVFYYATGKIELHLDSLLTENHTIQPFLLDAQLLPDLDKANQHQLVVDSFYFGLGEKNYAKGNLTIVNPESPYMDADFLASMKFRRLGDFLASEYIEFQEGFFTLDLNYQTPLYDTINAENYILKATVDGAAQIVDGNIFYNYRDFTFDAINGNFKFDQRALYIPNLELTINENKIAGTGECNDFFPFFILPDQRAEIIANLSSPHFDFGKFTAPEGLGKDTLIANIKTVINAEQDTLLNVSGPDAENMISQTVGLIDLLLSKGTLDMKTSIDNLVYNKFLGQAIKGNITMRSDTVQLRDMSMDMAQGNLTIDGLITETALHRPNMEIDLKLAGNNISEIFRQFEDFGQEAISHKHLQGFATAELAFKAKADADYSILPESLFGDLRFHLTGGQLKALPALSEVKGFLFRKRRLHDIAIDTLEVFASMRGTKLYVDKFNLHSTPFDLDVEGMVDLNNQNSTRFLLSAPMGNLNRRYIQPDDFNSKEPKRKGPRIFIESRIKKDRLRFFWKPIIFRKKTKYKSPEKVSPKIESN